MDEILQVLDVAALGVQGLLVVGLISVWRKLNQVLAEKDAAMKTTIEILKELSGK